MSIEDRQTFDEMSWINSSNPMRIAKAFSQNIAPLHIREDAQQESLLYLIQRIRKNYFKRYGIVNFECWAHLQIRNGMLNYLRRERDINA